MNAKELLSFITMICFTLSCACGEVLHAVADERGGSRLPRTLNDSVVPAAYGKVTDGRLFGGKQVVISIQDLHCHPEVQRNIAGILAALDERYGLERVYVEGGYGDIDTSRLCDIEDEKLKKEIVERLVDRGRITGGEYYSALAGRPRVLKGIDDESLHRANIVRLGKLLGKKERFERTLRELDDDLAWMKARYTGPRNRELDELVERHRAGSIPDGKYYRRLLKHLERINDDPEKYVSPANYPNLRTFLELDVLAGRLRYRSIARQLPEFLGLLRSKIPYREYSVLLEETAGFSRTGELHRSLARLAGSSGLLPLCRESFPDLYNLFEYTGKSRNLNPVAMLREEHLLREELRAGLSRSVGELEVSFLADFYSCFRDFLLNRLSADDYGYFTRRFEKFKRLWGKYAFRNRIAGLSEDCALLDEFYQANCERNEHFIKNIPALRLAGRHGASPPGPLPELLDNAELIVIVTGGFHTEGLKNLLAERKISHLTITPNATGDPSRSNAVYAALAGEQAALFASGSPLPGIRADAAGRPAHGTPDSLALASQVSAPETTKAIIGILNAHLKAEGITDLNALVAELNNIGIVSRHENGIIECDNGAKIELAGIETEGAPAYLEATLGETAAFVSRSVKASLEALLDGEELVSAAGEALAGRVDRLVALTLKVAAEHYLLTGSGLPYEIANDPELSGLDAIGGIRTEILARFPEAFAPFVKAIAQRQAVERRSRSAAIVRELGQPDRTREETRMLTLLLGYIASHRPRTASRVSLAHTVIDIDAYALLLKSVLQRGEGIAYATNSFKGFTAGEDYDPVGFLHAALRDTEFAKEVSLLNKNIDTGAYSPVKARFADQRHLREFIDGYLREYFRRYVRFPMPDDLFEAFLRKCSAGMTDVLTLITTAHDATRYDREAYDIIMEHLPDMVDDFLDTSLRSMTDEQQFALLFGLDLDDFAATKQYHKLCTDLLLCLLHYQLSYMQPHYEQLGADLFVTLNTFARELNAYVTRTYEDDGQFPSLLFLLRDGESLSWPFWGATGDPRVRDPGYLYFNRLSLMSARERDEYQARKNHLKSDFSKNAFAQDCKLNSFLYGNSARNIPSALETAVDASHRIARGHLFEFLTRNHYASIRDIAVKEDLLEQGVRQYQEDIEKLAVIHLAQQLYRLARSDEEARSTLENMYACLIPENLRNGDGNVMFVDSGFKGSLPLLLAALVLVFDGLKKPGAPGVHYPDSLTGNGDLKKFAPRARAFIYGAIRAYRPVVPNAGFSQWGFGGVTSFLDILPKFLEFHALRPEGFPVARLSGELNHARLIRSFEAMHRHLRNASLRQASTLRDIEEIIIDAERHNGDNPVYLFLDMDDVALQPAGHLGSEAWFREELGRIPDADTGAKSELLRLAQEYGDHLSDTGGYRTVLDAGALRRRLEERFPRKRINVIFLSNRSERERSNTVEQLKQNGLYDSRDDLDLRTGRKASKAERILAYLTSARGGAGSAYFVDDDLKNIAPVLKREGHAIVPIWFTASGQSRRTGLWYFEKAGLAEKDGDEATCREYYRNALKNSYVPLTSQDIKMLAKLSGDTGGTYLRLLKAVECSVSRLSREETVNLYGILKGLVEDDASAPVPPSLREVYGCAEKAVTGGGELDIDRILAACTTTGTRLAPERGASPAGASTYRLGRGTLAGIQAFFGLPPSFAIDHPEVNRIIELAFAPLWLPDLFIHAARDDLDETQRWGLKAIGSTTIALLLTCSLVHCPFGITLLSVPVILAATHAVYNCFFGSGTPANAPLTTDSNGGPGRGDAGAGVVEGPSADAEMRRYVDRTRHWGEGIFSAYMKSGILSDDGERLLAALRQQGDTANVRELYDVIRYFESIPGANGEDIKAGFPQRYFKELSIPEMFLGKHPERLTVNMLDGCPNNCFTCPLQVFKASPDTPGVSSVMPYPVLVMLARAGVQTDSNFYFEGLYYEDPCGALYDDVLKLDLIARDLASRGYGTLQRERAERNVERLNESSRRSGRRMDIYISISAADLEYFIMRKRGMSRDAIVRKYVERYLDFIRDVSPYHTIILRPFGFSGTLDAETKLLDAIGADIDAGIRAALTREGISHRMSPMRYEAVSKRLYARVRPEDRTAAWNSAIGYTNLEFTFPQVYVVHTDGKIYVQLSPKYVRFSELLARFPKELTPKTKEIEAAVRRQVKQAGHSFTYPYFGRVEDGKIDPSNVFIPLDTLERTVRERYIKHAIAAGRAPVYRRIPIHDMFDDSASVLRHQEKFWELLIHAPRAAPLAQPGSYRKAEERLAPALRHIPSARLKRLLISAAAGLWYAPLTERVLELSENLEDTSVKSGFIESHDPVAAFDAIVHESVRAGDPEIDQLKNVRQALGVRYPRILEISDLARIRTELQAVWEVEARHIEAGARKVLDWTGRLPERRSIRFTARLIRLPASRLAEIAAHFSCNLLALIKGGSTLARIYGLPRPGTASPAALTGEMHNLRELVNHIARSADLKAEVAAFRQGSEAVHAWFSELPQGFSGDVTPVGFKLITDVSANPVEAWAGVQEGSPVFFMDLRKAGIPEALYGQALGQGAAQIIAALVGTDKTEAGPGTGNSFRRILNPGNKARASAVGVKPVMVIDHTGAPEKIKRDFSDTGIDNALIVSSREFDRVAATDIDPVIRKMLTRRNALSLTLGENKLLHMDYVYDPVTGEKAEVNDFDSFARALHTFNEAGGGQMLVEWDRVFAQPLKEGAISAGTIKGFLREAKAHGVAVYCKHAAADEEYFLDLGFAGVIPPDRITEVRLHEIGAWNGRRIGDDRVLDVRIHPSMTTQQIREAFARLPLANTMIFRSGDASRLIGATRDVMDRKSFASLLNVLLNFGIPAITTPEKARRLGYNWDGDSLPELLAGDAGKRQIAALLAGTLDDACGIAGSSAVYEQAAALTDPALKKAFLGAIAGKMLILARLAQPGHDPAAARDYREGTFRWGNPAYETMLTEALTRQFLMTPRQAEADATAARNLSASAQGSLTSFVTRLHRGMNAEQPAPGSITVLIDVLLLELASEYRLRKPFKEKQGTLDIKAVRRVLSAA